MAKSQLPVKRAREVLKRWEGLNKEFDEAGLTNALIADSIKKLLNGQKRVVSYGAVGQRSSEMVPDSQAIAKGIEFWLEIRGLRHAVGFEQPEMGEAGNSVAVDAVIELTDEKLKDEWDAIAVKDWLNTEEGIAAVHVRMEVILKRDT